MKITLNLTAAQQEALCDSLNASLESYDENQSYYDDDIIEILEQLQKQFKK